MFMNLLKEEVLENNYLIIKEIFWINRFIQQNNNYVVFDEFFSIISSSNNNVTYDNDTNRAIKNFTIN